jgi:hypothetical protein
MQHCVQPLRQTSQAPLFWADSAKALSTIWTSVLSFLGNAVEGTRIIMITGYPSHFSSALRLFAFPKRTFLCARSVSQRAFFYSNLLLLESSTNHIFGCLLGLVQVLIQDVKTEALMMMAKKSLLLIVSASLGIAALYSAPLGNASPTQTAAQSTAVRPVGTIKAIAGTTITLTADSGPEVNVSVQDSTRMLQTAPGEKDLKNAVPIKLTDLQVGDRILVRGNMSSDGKLVVASSVIAIKKTDIAERQKNELQDWQKRGTGGLVKSVDPATGTVSISTTVAGAPKLLAVHASKNTIIRRYSPDSVKFDDAKPGTLDEIKPGDQLRTRGNRSADGTEFAAEEIVSGSFRNIAGLVSSIDSTKNTITVTDLATKKPVTVRITADSQVRKLPAMVAQMLAMRLKGLAPSDAARPGDAAANVRPTGAPAQGGARPGAEGGQRAAGPGAGGFGGGQRPGGDIQQMLSRMPAMPFSDFQKGDAVMIVTTQGSANSDVTAITLLSGVEAILTASPNGSGAASLLSPWSLGSSPGDATAVP